MITLVTADLPGTGGVCAPHDRRCTELLGGAPGGNGHWWIQVACDRLPNAQVRAAVARAAHCPVEDVAEVGNRDRHAPCVRWLSVPDEPVEHPNQLRLAGAHGKMRVLQVKPAARPVGPDDLASLRWEVRIHGAPAGAYERARAILDRLRRGGLANYFDPHAFGRAGELMRWGLLLLAGARLPGAARASEPHRLRRAAQEWLFNRWLSERVASGRLGSCATGERIAGPDGRLRLVDDPEPWQRRLDSFGASVLGPLFGEGCPPPGPAIAASEAELLAGAGLNADFCAVLRGGTRAARVQPQAVVVDLDRGGGVLVRCELPPETRIAALLAEVVKTEHGGPGDADA
jgi:tRNA(Glu) U13 pseudouridine synthase TruD